MLAEGNVKLVAVTHVSNVLGTINPVAEVAARARAAGAVCLVDGSQAVPQMPVDLHEVGADFYAWTAHKALGPSGLGILHGRRELLEAMPPFLGGGHMISQVGLESSTWAELPGKFEAGTSAITEAVGLGAAVDYLNGDRHGRGARPRGRPDRLRAGAPARGRGPAGVRPADAEARGGVISFELEGIHPHDLAEICDRGGVCIRAGHHCAQPLMRELGVSATARASFHVYSDREDVDRLVESLHEAREVFALCMDALYRDYILDHYKNPRNFGTLEPHDLEHHDHNPLCGDELGVHLITDDEGTITDLRFHGQGCAISQASASITSEELMGMKVDQIPDLSAEWVFELLGIPISPTRRKCALLSLKVMRGATGGDACWPE